MRPLAKVLNQFIWLVNFFCYQAHLETFRNISYEPYNFSKDIKYF